MATYWQLITTFMKIGAFTIGGGYAMVPLIEREVVENRRWVSKERFLDLLVVAQTVPGILAVNVAILVGKELPMKRASLACAIGTIVPSFVILLTLAFFVAQVQDSPLFVKMFKAIRPAVVALIAVPVIRLSQSANLSLWGYMVLGLSALSIWLLGVSPLWIIVTIIALVTLNWLRVHRGDKGGEQ